MIEFLLSRQWGAVSVCLSVLMLQLTEVCLLCTKGSSGLSRQSSAQLPGAGEVEAEPRRTVSRAAVPSSRGSVEVKDHRQTCGVNL